MKDIRGHGGVKSISTGGSAGPSAFPSHCHQCAIGRVSGHRHGLLSSHDKPVRHSRKLVEHR